MADDKMISMALYVLTASTEDVAAVSVCLLNLLLIFQRLKAMNRQRQFKTRIQHYCLDVIPRYNPDEFRIHFRMNRITTEVIYGEITGVLRHHRILHLSTRLYKGGRVEFPLQDKLLMFLWYMANKDSYREVANLFGICEATCCKIVHALLTLFTTHLLTKFIRWPTNHEKREIASYFEETKNFPNVIGFIDGCHIPIKKPHEGGAMYYNRKDFYSIVLQAVCREDLRFVDIFVGFAGRVHDARVFSYSPLFEQGPLMCGEYHLLGDSAYPNLEWLLTPFRRNQNLTPNMTRFNQVFSSMRITIERAFALLKGRFRRLKYIDQYDNETMSYTTVTACCLHNICILQDDIEEYVENDPQVPVALLPPGIFNPDGVARGMLKRNRIMNRLAT